MRRVWKGAWMLAAPPSWSASFVPMVVGYFAAVLVGHASVGKKEVLWIFLSFLAMSLVETGKHAVNDIVDYRSGNDKAVDAEHQTHFSGGKKALTTNVISVREAAGIALVTFAAASLLGLLLVLFQSREILWICVAGLILSVIYTMPPFQLCYRGLGELAVGFVYGPLIMAGAYVLLTHQMNETVWWLSLSIGCLITNVLIINEYPDYEADLTAGKRNLVARAGKENALKWYLGMFLASYLPILVLVFRSGNPGWLVLLLLLPGMIKCWCNCREHYDNISKLVWSNQKTIRLHQLSGILMILVMIFQKI